MVGRSDLEGCKAPATMNIANPESLVTDDVKITIKFCGGNLSESSSSHQSRKIQMKIVCNRSGSGRTLERRMEQNIMEEQKRKFMCVTKCFGPYSTHDPPTTLAPAALL